MKVFYLLVIIIFSNIHAQTIDQIKKQLKDSGISNKEAKQIARDKGFSDNQIEDEIQSRKIELDVSAQLDQERSIDQKDTFNNFDENEEVIDKTGTGEITEWMFNVTNNSMFNMKYQLRLNDLFDLADVEMIHYTMVMDHLELLDNLLVGTVIK